MNEIITAIADTIEELANENTGDLDPAAKIYAVYRLVSEEVAERMIKARGGDK